MIDELLPAIEKTFPMPGRFRSKLPNDIAELSRLLTSARGERDNSYLNRPNLLSAYLRYFLPWNVFRLCRLFEFNTELPDRSQNMLPELTDGDAIIDLGCGPLVLPIAMWLAFPRLRRTELEFRCVDKSAAALDAGYKLFKSLSAVSGEGTAWKIKIIHDSMEKPIRGKAAKLVAALNVFNEVLSLHHIAKQNMEKAAVLLHKLCAENGSIFVMEPGNPQGGAFIAALRSSLLEKGHFPLAPCTHAGSCPLLQDGGSTGKGKWCHFAHKTKTETKTKAAPLALHKLSLAAGIPKERAVFSFLLTNRINRYISAAPPLRIRIISDAFPVSLGRKNVNMGCYGCSEKGLILAVGSKTQFNAVSSGALLEIPFQDDQQSGKQWDSKSGALIMYI